MEFCLSDLLSGKRDNFAASRVSRSRMVCANAKRGEQQLLTARMLASTVRFNRNENCINIFERLRIVSLQDPSLFAGVVLVEDAQTARLLLVRSFSAPRLERSCVLQARLRIQIERIENQRLSFGVEDAPVRFLCALS